MKKIIAMIALSLVIATVFYQIGWYRGLAYEAVASAIVRGQIDVGTALALRKRDVPAALKWVELDLDSTIITLNGFREQIPKEFADGFRKVSAALDQYRTKYKSTPR